MMSAVAEAVSRQEISFEDFFRAEYPPVYRAAFLSTGSPEAAHDVTQEAFARAFARWRRLRKHEWAGGWVMTTAMNLSRRHARRPVLSQLRTVTRGPSGTRVDLASAIKRLPVRQRTAIALFYLRDLPIPQIAQVMQISEGTVKAHLAQARAALRQMLEEHDG